jgi:hemolysin activation/secretion protein
MAALIGCMAVSTRAAPSEPERADQWYAYADRQLLGTNDLREKREHWLRSRLKFSGKTRMDNEGMDGHLGLSMDGLIWSEHAAGLDFTDRTNRKDADERSSLAFRYSFPAGRSRIRLRMENAEYTQAARNDRQRFLASGEATSIGISGHRPLASLYEVSIDSVFSHLSRNKRREEQGVWVSDSDYRLSTFGLEGRRNFELLSGIKASGNLLALGGYEYQGNDCPAEGARSEQDRFHKVAVSASLRRELMAWQWGIDGRYQFASDHLPGSERMLIAGNALITGFNGQSVSVAEGGWLRMDTRSPSYPVPFTRDLLSSVRLSVVRGWAPDTGVQSELHGLTSAGQVSVNLTGRSFVADLSVGRMLESSSAALEVPDHPDVRLSLTMDI